MSNPGFNAPKVTVLSAQTAASVRPLSASSPEGTSTASTAAPGGAAGATYPPRSPVP